MSIEQRRISKINGLELSNPKDTFAFAERVAADGAIVENLPAVERVLNSIVPEHFVDFGKNLITNGNFNSDTAWTKGTDWSIGSGVATRVTGAANSDISQTILPVVTEGATFQFTVEITAITSDSVKVRVQGGSDVNIPDSIGIHTVEVVAGSSGTTRIRSTQITSDVSIDNISVKEVINKTIYPESLVMIPSAGKAGVLSNQVPSDGDFTVTGTNGTRTNELGLIVPRIDDAPRIDYSDNKFVINEPESENLFDYSQELDNALLAKENLTISPNAIIAPDGTLTADQLIETTSNSRHRLRDQINNMEEGADYTISLFVKKNSDSRFCFINAGGAIGGSGWFDLDDQSSSSALTVIPYPNEWYRIYITGTATTNATFYIQMSPVGSDVSYLGDGSSVYYWGIQVSKTNTITRYVHTPALAPVGIPPTYRRVGVGALLIEPESENLLLRSEELDNGSWVKSGSLGLVVEPNQAISPDGTLNADKLTPVIGSGTALVRQTTTNSGDLTYTVSVYAKTDGFDNFRLRLANGVQSSRSDVYFNLVTGAVSTPTSTNMTNPSASIVALPNGWYRCSLTGTFGTETTIQFVAYPSEASDNSVVGDGIKGILLWGAQLELGSLVTTYIPTTTVAVTRDADVITQGGNYETLDTDEGVLFFEAKDGNPLHSTERDISLSDGSLVNNVIIRYGGDPNQVEVIISRNPGLEVFFDVTITDTTVYNKFAIKWKQNDFALWINGVELATNTTSNAPITLDRLNFDNGVGGDLFIGSVRQIRVFPSALTDAQLKKLTT